MNFIDARIIRENGLWIKSNGLKLKIPEQFYDALENYIDKEVIFGIRPENIYDKMFAMAPKEGENTGRAKVDVVEPLGSETILHLVAGEDRIVAVVDPKTEAKENQEIDLVFDMNTMHIFDKETQKAVI